jgi:hypothetical protein
MSAANNNMVALLVVCVAVAMMAGYVQRETIGAAVRWGFYGAVVWGVLILIHYEVGLWKGGAE